MVALSCFSWFLLAVSVLAGSANARNLPQDDELVEKLLNMLSRYLKDETLTKRQSGNYVDENFEQAIRHWMEGVTGIKLDPNVPENVPLGESRMHSALKSGVYLCNLANVIMPGAVPSINKQPMPYADMDNINSFIGFMQYLGVKDEYLFKVYDLYDQQNMAQVMIGLRALGTKATEMGVPPAITI